MGSYLLPNSHPNLHTHTPLFAVILTYAYSHLHTHTHTRVVILILIGLVCKMPRLVLVYVE
ncbi:hypothetical protein B0H34DRAFT_118669 [Crassisporium funariophilum]|nr:hypothetical protein B0H34DRAFT_118669 [Crassisporium funariophilum]